MVLPKASAPFSNISSSGLLLVGFWIGVTSSPLASCSSRLAICLVICAMRASSRAFFSSGVSADFLGVLGFSSPFALSPWSLTTPFASSLSPFASLPFASCLSELPLLASALFLGLPRFFLALTSSPFALSPWSLTTPFASLPFASKL